MAFPYHHDTEVVDRLISVTSISTTPYQVLYADKSILVDAVAAPITVTLPPVLDSRGRRYYIKKVDSSGNAVTINTGG